MEQEKKVALITGGGSGIGFGIAEKFIEKGMQTLLVARDEEKLKAACAQLGASCHYKTCDLADLKTIPALIQNILSEYGRIDVLVNNAGINMKKDFTEVTDEDFQKIITVNLCSVFSISREVVKDMIRLKSGSIINISSMAAQYGLPRVIAYSASKSAIEGMTRAMASELSPHGIRINCIAPGFIETAMTAKALNDDPPRKAKALGRTPMGKMGKPADIGAAAAFFASDESAYITGTVLCVDGGNAIGF
ncbi:MAG TPA: SDR family oxidoreductase [Saprospiraceae bacterium]|nr:SDR family oxidoreductase [Saprospiraceae bacterium]HNT20072.1 SDR family oxidoreductase [Saprospiraceae bacterium]